MSDGRLIYLPLGGAGEIGMNTYVYGYGPEGDERLIVVDLGVTFPDMETTPGVDLIMADIAWLEARKDQIEGIFITHAHEDHVGAVGHLYDKLQAPVYCRRFTAIHARRKLEEYGVPEDAVTVLQPWPEAVTAGPFKVGFLPVSHSIPESSALVIDVGGKRLVHTGDFKIDTDPVVGEPFDEALWASVAKPGVDALICDSTNVFSRAPGRSEATLKEAITDLVAGAEGMVVATTFASNVARLQTLATAAVAAGRSVCLLGRAMRRMVEAAVEAECLTDFPSVVSPEQAADIPRQNLFLLTTGSQGERRAATAQLSRGKFLGLEMAEGDMMLFSSKIIPGNEREVIRIWNAFSEMGVDVVAEDDLYHVSGHANRPDLERMHRMMSPKALIPMHGEHRHLREHTKLGEASGIPSLIAVNGTLVEFTGNGPRVAEFIETGRRYLDGRTQIGALDGIVRDRIRMALNGHVLVTLILDEEDEPLGEPWCETMGLPEVGNSNAPLAEVIEADLSQFLGRAKEKTLRDDDELEEGIRRITRKTAHDEIGKKPEVTVVVSRLS